MSLTVIFFIFRVLSSALKRGFVLSGILTMLSMVKIIMMSSVTRGCGGLCCIQKTKNNLKVSCMKGEIKHPKPHPVPI